MTRHHNFDEIHTLELKQNHNIIVMLSNSP